MPERDSPWKLPEQYDRIGGIKRPHEKDLLAKSNVVGVGVGNKYVAGEDTGTPCIVVMVSTKLPRAELEDADLVPSTLDDVPTDVVETGLIQADGDFNARLRPAPGGTSVSHRNGPYTGTLGTGCVDEEQPKFGRRKYYLLSCNHVLANHNQAIAGDYVLQPGVGDGGTYPADIVGRLDRWVPIQFCTPTPTGFICTANYADAAIALTTLNRVNREIHWLGYPRRFPPSGYLTYGPGTRVLKMGTTSGLTEGEVTAVSAVTIVNYPLAGGQVAMFKDVIVTTRMSKPGDSGAIACEPDYGVALGMVFASGTHGPRSATFLNPVWWIESLLDISIAPA